MRVPLQKIPLDVRRRAAQRLESIRGSAMGKGADTVRLGPGVYPLHRPDLEEVAYYEFELVAGSSSGVQLVTADAAAAHLFERQLEKEPAAGRRGGRGFLIASAGPHDFPMPHWSLESAPPSRLLEQLASGTEKSVARIYKLDALAYVGESGDGERVATLGDLPKLYEGLPHDLRRQRRGISSLIARPAGEGTDEQPDGEHRIERKGAEAPKLEPVEIESWQQFKDRYADLVGPFLEELRRRADEAWDVERLIEEYGEGILVGETHRIALLDDRAKVEASGEAVDSVEIRILERQPAPAAVELRAVSLPDDPRADLELTISYPEKETERLRFFVVSRDVPSNPRGYRPPMREEPL